MRKVSAELPDRFEALRRRLRTSRLGRSVDGIIALPLLGIALVLGVFTAVAATGRSSDAVESDLALARVASEVGADVVTETERHVIIVTEPGKRNVVTVERERVRRRVLRGPGGVSTVLESVPGPSQTKTVAGPTKTVTVRGPSHTVTQVRTETVTTVVTVTEEG
jgi:hypothetical protein